MTTYCLIRLHNMQVCYGAICNKSHLAPVTAVVPLQSHIFLFFQYVCRDPPQPRRGSETVFALFIDRRCSLRHKSIHDVGCLPSFFLQRVWLLQTSHCSGFQRHDLLVVLPVHHKDFAAEERCDRSDLGQASRLFRDCHLDRVEHKV